jgi:hypothetical protein
METTLLQALDDVGSLCFAPFAVTLTRLLQLTSTRSTWNTQDNALLSLERVLARTLLSQREDADLAREELLRLQDLFEHNSTWRVYMTAIHWLTSNAHKVSSRVLSWLSCHISELNAKKSRHCTFIVPWSDFHR